ncbi:flagellar biosynthesis anti-sigma factor FlgM [Streptomyces sp. 150FB]|uniref:M4 family metallopeptidase n=1 Tax=Streptomyces sp. 150FB TaxID=1576605 RepID=UPI000588FF35|nr:M4 family metallopeptidase [Streptomyces sp. 150FB]KIF72851.1 flagellar biosynthesis anti-sigma factor FlgM [Streptomyces sp. 150FB]
MRAPFISKLAIAVTIVTAASASITATAMASPAPHSVSTQAASQATVAHAASAAAFARETETGLSRWSGLVATDVMVDQSGKQHVRFSQTYRGLPVVGADIVVHLTPGSKYLGVTRAADKPVSVPSVAAKLTVKQAQSKAASAVQKGAAAAPRLLVNVQDGKSVLAYQVTVTAGGDVATSHSVVVDAGTGSVVSNVSTMDEFISPKVRQKLKAQGERATPSLTGRTATPKAQSPALRLPSPAVGSGASMYNGTVTLNTTQTATNQYTLVDTTRGQTEIRNDKNSFLADPFNDATVMTDSDNKWGNATTSDINTAGVDAQYGLTKTFDFYKNTFGRDGIRDDGVGPQGAVHYGQNYGNAGWSDDCWCMIYGDGDGVTFTKPLTQLDVTGHELTHGVVASTAGLQGTFVGEPGSLNESLADIFGSNVEFSSKTAAESPNYLMGEQLGLSQGFLRRLDHPSLDKLEGAVDYWSTNAPQTEVHAGSGVSSHAYYLLAEGSGSKTINGIQYNSATFDGSTVTGIGREKATAIFYQALTRYMVSTTDFHDARTATLQAAADLYGQGGTEYNTVDKAWAAVNVTASNG